MLTCIGVAALRLTAQHSGTTQPDESRRLVDLAGITAEAQRALEIVFESEKRPYLDESFIAGFSYTGDLALNRRRHYSIGIRNRGSTTIRGCRVILERVRSDEPISWHGRPVRLRVTGSRDALFDAAPSLEEPSTYVDVIYQKASHLGEAHRVYIASADVPDDDEGLTPGGYEIALRVEGGDAVARRVFLVEKKPYDAPLLMWSKGDEKPVASSGPQSQEPSADDLLPEQKAMLMALAYQSGSEMVYQDLLASIGMVSDTRAHAVRRELERRALVEYEKGSVWLTDEGKRLGEQLLIEKEHQEDSTPPDPGTASPPPK